MQIAATAEIVHSHAPARDRAWWEHPALLAVLVLLAAAPLVYPALPPLTDLPGHVSHYHIERALETSPHLGRFYGFEWALIGNLGVDLLMIPAAWLFGVELGAKLIAMLIPCVTIAGFLAVAQAIHGRVPPVTLFALPLAYSFPFQFGFLNYSLSVGLCLLLFALWLRLARRGRLRAALFVPLSCALWVCHTYGWGLLGVFAFAAELAGRRERGLGWIEAGWRGAMACLPLALPFLFMVAWQTGGDVEGDTGNFFAWGDKLVWLMCILREHWLAWDMAGAALLLGLALVALRGRDLQLAPVMQVAVILLAGLYLVMPRILIGSGFADMRLAPVMIAAALIGTRPIANRRVADLLAAAAIAFFAARLLVSGLTFGAIDRVWQEQLGAVEQIAPGSRVLTLTEVPCPAQWATNRTNHVNSLAVARRDAFTNAQWAVGGAQMLKVKYPGAGPFHTDPSHLMRPPECAIEPDTIAQAVAAVPGAFDYLWLLDVPEERWPSDPRLVIVWRGQAGVLYRAKAE